MPDVLPPAIPPKKKNLKEEVMILNPLESTLPSNSPSSTSSPLLLLPPKPMRNKLVILVYVYYDEIKGTACS